MHPESIEHTFESCKRAPSTCAYSPSPVQGPLIASLMPLGSFEQVVGEAIHCDLTRLR